jgi:RNA polymerase sigma factor (sigma-70 family)
MTAINSELKTLYKTWPDQKRYLKSIGCQGPIAEDIFQEALLIYIRKIAEPDFELTVAPFHFVKSTCKFLWYNHKKKRGLIFTDNETYEAQQEEESDWMQKELRISAVEKALNQLGDQCQQMLHMFYGLGSSLVEIAKKLNLRSDNAAKTMKFRCLEKARASVLEMDIETENSKPL